MDFKSLNIRALIDDSLFPAILFNCSDYSIIDINQEAVESFSFKKPELLNKSLTEFIDVAESELYKSKKDANKSRWQVEAELKVKGKNSALVDLHFRKLNDEVCLALIIEKSEAATTLSQRYASLAEELKREKNKLEGITRSLDQSALVSITDKKGTIIHANEEFCRVSKYDKADLVGANHNILNSGHHPKAFWKEMWRTISTGRRWRAEVKNKAKDGSYYWVDTVINPIFDNEGTIDRYLSIRYLITDKKQNEEHISQLLSTLGEVNHAINNTSIVTRADKSGKITYVNANFVEISGYSVEELIGKDHKVVNSGHHPKSFWQEMWKTTMKGDIWRAEVKNRAKNGSFYWVDTFIVPFFDKDGKIREYLSIRNDITKRKQQEQKIIENEKHFRQLYNESPVMMHSIDVNGKILTVSDHWLQTLGYEREEVIGKKSSDFLSKSSKAYAEKIVLPLFFKDGYCSNIEYQFVKKNGNIIDVILNATAYYDHDGKFNRSIAVIVDITDRKKMENELLESREMLANMANNLPGAILRYKSIKDKVDLIEFISKGSQQIWELKPQEIIDNPQAAWNKIHPDDFTHFTKAYSKALESLSLLNHEYRVVKSSGEIIWVKVMAQPKKLNKDVVQWNALALDITARKHSELENRKLLVELEWSLKEKEALFQELHHRIKNNLQIITSVLFLKSSSEEDQKLKSFIEDTSTRINSISAIHEHLLQIKSVKEVHIRDYLLQLIYSNISAHGLSNQFSLDEDIQDVKMDIDKVLYIGLIVNEVIINSIKHAYPIGQEGKLQIKFHKKKGKHYMSIADNGKGFNPEEFEKNNSFGFQMISLMTDQLRGSLRMESKNGCKFYFEF